MSYAFYFLICDVIFVQKEVVKNINTLKHIYKIFKTKKPFPCPTATHLMKSLDGFELIVKNNSKCHEKLIYWSFTWSYHIKTSQKSLSVLFMTSNMMMRYFLTLACVHMLTISSIEPCVRWFLCINPRDVSCAIN
jgi:hypothetical protein